MPSRKRLRPSRCGRGERLLGSGRTEKAAPPVPPQARANPPMAINTDNDSMVSLTSTTTSQRNGVQTGAATRKDAASMKDGNSTLSTDIYPERDSEAEKVILAELRNARTSRADQGTDDSALKPIVVSDIDYAAFGKGYAGRLKVRTKSNLKDDRAPRASRERIPKEARKQLAAAPVKCSQPAQPGAGSGAKSAQFVPGKQLQEADRRDSSDGKPPEKGPTPDFLVRSVKSAIPTVLKGKATPAPKGPGSCGALVKETAKLVSPASPAGQGKKPGPAEPPKVLKAGSNLTNNGVESPLESVSPTDSKAPPVPATNSHVFIRESSVESVNIQPKLANLETAMPIGRPYEAACSRGPRRQCGRKKRSEKTKVLEQNIERIKKNIRRADDLKKARTGQLAFSSSSSFSISSRIEVSE